MTAEILSPCGIMFHHFHGEGYSPSQGSISAVQLDRMIGLVGRDRIISAGEWHERAVTGRLAKTNVCLTFDDALRCQLDVALPVLEAHKLTAFWFIYSSVFEGIPERLEIYRHFRHTSFPSIESFYAAFFAEVEQTPLNADARRSLETFDPKHYLPTYRYLSTSDKTFRFLRDRVLGIGNYVQIMDGMMRAHGIDPDRPFPGLWMSDHDLKALSDAEHIVGLHSYSHPTVLAGLPEPVQRNEFQKNYDHIIRATGSRPTAMAHPCNSYDATTLRILDDFGIQVGFRANMDLMNGGNLEYPRLNHATLAKAI
jgi:peptidoglycan/xylan/chitin deacetylase (PgdA/CDA1 family)